MTDGRISICMTTHNGASFLRDQLESLLPQLREGDELVVADDNSTDDTELILQSYSDKRIRILPKRKFNNPVQNFEYVLKESKNNIVFLADQDDIWSPDKVEVMMRELQTFDLVVCDCSLVDEKLRMIAPSFFQINKSKNGVVNNFIRNSFVGCCMAFHRSVLEKALPFPTGLPAHDQWIGLIASKYFTVKFLSQPLVFYRRHDRNYSTTGNRSRNSIGKKLISRFRLAKELTSR